MKHQLTKKQIIAKNNENISYFKKIVVTLQVEKGIR